MATTVINVSSKGRPPQITIQDVKKGEVFRFTHRMAFDNIYIMGTEGTYILLRTGKVYYRDRSICTSPVEVFDKVTINVSHPTQYR